MPSLARPTRAVLVVALSLLLAACDLARPPEAGPTYVPATPSPVVDPNTTVQVKRANLVAQLKVRGRVVSSSEFTMSFNRTGTIKAVNVQTGSHVEPGALLLQLDDSDLQDRIQDAQVNLAMARDDLARAQLPLPQGQAASAAKAVTAAQQDLDTAKLKLAQAQATPTANDLAPFRAAVGIAQVAETKAENEYNYRHDRGLESYQQEMDLKTARYNLLAAQAALDKASQGAGPDAVALAQATVRSAQTALDSAKASYDYSLQSERAQLQQHDAAVKSAQNAVQVRQSALTRLQGQLADLVLRAPFAGNVVSLDAQVGATVAPFQSLGILANPGKPEVEADVPQESLALLAPGAAAQVVVDGSPDAKYKATLREIPSQPTLWQGKQIYQVRLGFADPAKAPASIRAGSDVYFSVPRSQALVIPLGAVLGDVGQRYVEMPGAGGKRKVPVVVGLTNDAEAEIIGGLQEGDTIAVPASR